MSESLRDFRPGEDEDGVRALWDRCFGDASGGQTVEWLFRPGPAGDCPRTVAVVDGRIVAHAGVAAMRFRLGDEVVLGGYSVGAMTDPAMRGRRLFYRVGCALYERLEREGFGFVAGFSNAQSHRLMTGPLERTAIRPFPWCVKILRPFSIARSLLGRPPRRPAEADPPESRRSGVEITRCAPDEARLDDLWARCESELHMAGVRDAAFSRWRFGTRPDARYRGAMAVRDGAVAAWGVYRTLELRGLRGGFIVDLLVAPGEVEAGRALLDTFAETARREGAELLSALRPRSGATGQALGRFGFRRIPERLHPQVIRFSVRGLGRFAGRPELVDPASWHLSWADTDVV
ncbi:MAG: GNAT family N-acetyltransferase [Myxococcota bacterium]